MAKGAEAGEVCGLCRVAMNPGTTVCGHCGARRWQGLDIHSRRGCAAQVTLLLAIILSLAPACAPAVGYTWVSIIPAVVLWAVFWLIVRSARNHVYYRKPDGK